MGPSIPASTLLKYLVRAISTIGLAPRSNTHSDTVRRQLRRVLTYTNVLFMVSCSVFAIGEIIKNTISFSSNYFIAFLLLTSSLYVGQNLTLCFHVFRYNTWLHLTNMLTTLATNLAVVLQVTTILSTVLLQPFLHSYDLYIMIFRHFKGTTLGQKQIDRNTAVEIVFLLKELYVFTACAVIRVSFLLLAQITTQCLLRVNRNLESILVFNEENTVKSFRWTLEQDTVEQLRVRFGSACDIRDSLNKLYSPQVLTDLIIAFIDIIFLTFALNDPIDAKKVKIAEKIFCILCRVVQIIIIVGTVEKIPKQLMAFSQEVLHRKSAFTAGGFFDVDYGLICNMVGAITTYTIISFQFQ